MSFTALSKILLFAYQSFWRNFWLSLVTITIIVLMFISVNFLIIVNVISDASIQIIKDKIDISIYFRPEVPEVQVQEAQSYLSSLAEVEQITYISQQQALEIFRSRHQEDKAIIDSIEELGENPIGATLQIKAKSIEDYPTVVSVLENSRYESLILDKNFDDHQVYIAKVQNISDGVKKIGITVLFVFVFIAALIVFNTIRVAIYTHRQEINIMKLVGASNWFIRSPFLMEGVFYGLLAWGLALVITYPLLHFIQPHINNFFLTEQFSIVQYFQKNIVAISAVQLLTIILLNVISSSIAIRRYLKV